MKAPRIFRAIAYVYKQAFWPAILSDALFFLSTFFEMWSIGVGGKFIDETSKVLQNWDQFILLEYLASDSFWFLCLALLLWSGSMLINRAREYFAKTVETEYYRKVQLEIIDVMERENLQEVESGQFQDLMSFVQSYSLDNILWAYQNFSKLIRQGIRFLSSLLIVYRQVGPWALVLVLLPLPETISEYLNLKKSAKFFDKTVRRVKYIEYINGLLLDISNFIELKVSNLFDYFQDTLNRRSGRQDRGVLKRVQEYQLYKAFFSLLGHFLLSGYFVYLISVSILQKLTIGNFKALYDYSYACHGAAYQFFHSLFLLKKNTIYVGKFFDLVEYEGFGDLATGNAKLPKGTPKIEFQNLDFLYPIEKVKALENVNFTINPGEKVVFVGGDGSGKTSLLKVLCGLYKITAGDYLISDYSIRELARGELKKKISLFDQDFVRYYFTIKKNIIVGKQRLYKSRYEAVKEVADVDKFMKKEGLDDGTVLGKYFSGGRDISQGYWQRIAIARTLYDNKRVFIMDEPFTYIGESTTRKILKKVIKHIGKERTLILITRDEENFDLFDKVFYLKGGSVKELKN